MIEPFLWTLSLASPHGILTNYDEEKDIKFYFHEKKSTDRKSIGVKEHHLSNIDSP